MAVYVGFSTQGSDAVRKTQINSGGEGGAGSITNPVRTTKKYRLTDQQLVIQDFLNALNIPQGQKPGNPAYGTTLWGFIFEPNTLDIQQQIEAEVRRIGSLDPRMAVNSVVAYPQENGILLEVEIQILPLEETLVLSLFFDQETNTAVNS
jgi:phage baseplate assembly protein W